MERDLAFHKPVDRCDVRGAPLVPYTSSARKVQRRGSAPRWPPRRYPRRWLPPGLRDRGVAGSPRIGRSPTTSPPTCWFDSCPSTSRPLCRCSSWPRARSISRRRCAPFSITRRDHSRRSTSSAGGV